jgi:tRNA-dihydrouridine synthase A
MQLPSTPTQKHHRRVDPPPFADPRPAPARDVLASSPLSVAPMMERTTRHFRRLLRRITRSTLLYTEMITTRAVLQDPGILAREREGEDGPLALQLGGNDPLALARCATWAEEAGFGAVNLNCGCPSTAASDGCFGARLMAEPERVAECIAAMKAATRLPVTVKHRIGIDDRDTFADLVGFVDAVASAGCDAFIVHARKAWLSGLDPRANRTIPPLRHHDVVALKRARPHLRVETNGGIETLDVASAHIGVLDGVMIGRAAYANPWILADADARIFGRDPVAVDRRAVLEGLCADASEWVSHGGRLHDVTRHAFGFVSGMPGARRFRGLLSNVGPRTNDPAIVREAIAFVCQS